MSDERVQDARAAAIREMSRQELVVFVAGSIEWLGDDQAVSVLSNRFCTPAICATIAESSRLTSYYDVKQTLVKCRATPQHIALKYVRYLYWSDLVRFSTDVRILPPVRRAMDVQLSAGLAKLAVGERVSAAKLCSRDLTKTLMVDPDRRVFAALLDNPRLREEDLAAFVQSDRAPVEHIRLAADHRKWGFRYAIRRATAFNPNTPRAIAASQLRHLRRQDRAALLRDPATSVYLRRCLETLEGASADAEDSSPSPDDDGNSLQ